MLVFSRLIRWLELGHAVLLQKCIQGFRAYVKYAP